MSSQEQEVREKQKIASGEKVKFNSPGEFQEYVLAEFKKGASRMDSLQEMVEENTAITKKLGESIAAMLSAFTAAVGTVKTLDFVGKVGKPLAWLAFILYLTADVWEKIRIKLGL